MIQNADDAGAKKVQFFVDHRTHSTANILLPALANYQGPALLSANDAMFSDQDWEGIQNLQQSGKADDPFKVGRFGIGFNSVYHLTGKSFHLWEYCDIIRGVGTDGANISTKEGVAIIIFYSLPDVVVTNLSGRNQGN